MRFTSLFLHRLVAPVKLGLKNVKAVTRLTYVVEVKRLLGRTWLFLLRRNLIEGRPGVASLFGP